MKRKINMLSPGRICAAMRGFLHAETGAVTVDWVVITAAIAGMALLVVGSVRLGTNSVAEEVRSAMEGAEVVSIEIGAGSPSGPGDDDGGDCDGNDWVPAEQPGCTTNGCDLACR